MIEPIEDRTPPMTPQLALRVAVVGSIALIMFALIFFRLWYLQVLSGNQYAQAAQTNIVRHIPLSAPRGEILAANGLPLVDSEQVPAIQIAPHDLPVPVTLEMISTHPVQEPVQDDSVFGPLAKLLHISTKPVSCRYIVYLTKPHKFDPKLSPIACKVAQSVANSQFANATIKINVRRDVAFYINERQTQSQFKGVSTADVYIRQYPNNNGDMFAAIYGELAQPSGDEVGVSGLEYEYNRWLRGRDGYQSVEVNSANQFEGYTTGKASTQGDDLQTSLDVALQRVGMKALQHSITANSPANSGAFVAMDPDNGQIYAMGSLPTYNPNWLVPPISTQHWNELNGSPNHPLINRAIQSPLPNGSTFKPITATAALESGVWSTGDTYDDTGQFQYELNEPCTVPGNCLHNSGHSAAGTINLVQALQISDDDFFYNLGDKLNSDAPDGGALQSWARQYGVGQRTGVDLPDESPGLLPAPKLMASLYKQEIECENATGPYKGHPKQPASKGGCGIANPQENQNIWTAGDNVNTGVGQGYDQITPMQLAVVYAALAHRGGIVTPHIADSVKSPSGTLLSSFDPGIKRTVQINPSYLQTILEGLHEAAQSPGGTSYDVMGSFPREVYGKTGTAQEGTAEQIATNTETDYSWYACFVPDTVTKRPIVIVVSVEKGGFGDVAAAPVARQMLSQWFLGKPGPYVSGSSNENTT